jgi:hypothetical protein
MMIRPLLVPIVLTSLLASACLRASTTGSTSQPSSTNGTGDGPSYAAAVAKLTDACPLMPADYVQKLVPGALAPEKERYPLRCTVRNDKSALEITFDTGPDEPIKGADSIAGLAKAAYLERLDPVARGDVYLTVILGKDENETNRNLHVEVAGHDGKDHKDDAIAVARDILAHLR